MAATMTRPLAVARETLVPRRLTWDWFLLFWCVGFHVLAGLVFLFAPEDLLYTEGTLPAFALMSRYAWALLYFLCAGSTLAVARWRIPALQMASAILIAGTGGAWFATLVAAATHGQGSALGLVVWPFLYGPWGVVAVRLGLHRFR